MFPSHDQKGRQELFVMARNQDEVNAILNQNDASGKSVIETRRQVRDRDWETVLAFLYPYDFQSDDQ